MWQQLKIKRFSTTCTNNMPKPLILFVANKSLLKVKIWEANEENDECGKMQLINHGMHELLHIQYER